MGLYFFSNDDGEPARTRILREVWSDAARKAAAAARGGRGKGLSVRKSLARAAFAAAGGKRRSDISGEEIRRAQKSDIRHGMHPEYGPRSWEKKAYKHAVSTYKARRAARGIAPKKVARRKRRSGPGVGAYD